MNSILLNILLWVASHQNTSTLKIQIENIQAGRGSIVVEVYNNTENFFKKPFASQISRAARADMQFSFDLPQGIYAVAAYQDLNDNRTLDKGWFSIPKEPYGLSNNYRPKFSAPTFNDCKFTLTQNMSLEIFLK